MGYRKKPDFTDIDNLNDATETFYERQRKELGKSFQIAYIWDMFARYIVIGIAVVAFLAGLLTGWLIFGGSSSGGNNTFSAEVTSEAEPDPEPEPPEEDEPSAAVPEDSGDDSEDDTMLTTAPETPADDDTTTETTTAPERDDDKSTDTAKKTTAGTTRRGETTARPAVTDAPAQEPVTPPVHTTRAPARTTVRATARPTVRTTVKTTAKPPVVTTVTTAKPVDTSKRNLGVSVSLKSAFSAGDSWVCTFNVTLTNNRSVAMSTQQAKLNVPGGCTLNGGVGGGTASLSGTLLTLTSTTPLSPGKSNVITFSLQSNQKLSAGDLIVR